MAKLKYTFVPNLNRSISLAKTYALKGLPMPDGIAGEALAKIGMSFGNQQLVGTLKQQVQEISEGNYVKKGFPYRREVVASPPEGVTADKASRIREVDNAIKRKDSNQLVQGSKIGDSVVKLKEGTLTQSYVTSSIELVASPELKSKLNEFYSQSQVTRKLYILVFPNLNKGNSFDKIELPFIPETIEVKPKTTWVDITAFGRNSPPVQYLHSKDYVTFDIDWYSTKGNYEEVFSYCKKIEAYTRGNGYDQAPPVVNLIGVVGVEDYDYIIKSAPYVIKQFTGMRDLNKIVPLHVIQTVTLQRVSLKNPTWQDIMYRIIKTN